MGLEPITFFGFAYLYRYKQAEGFALNTNTEGAMKLFSAILLPLQRLRRANFGSTLLIALFLLTLSAGCASDEARSTYDEGSRLLSNGEYLSALAKFDTVARFHQDSPYAPKSQYMLASIYSRNLGEIEKAKDAYFALYYNYPESPEALNARKDLADIYSTSGEHERAVVEYQWVVDKSPEERYKYRYLIGMEYLKMNEIAQARVEFNDLLALGLEPEPDGTQPKAIDSELLANIYFQIAGLHYLEGDNEAAIAAYDDFIERFAGHPLVLEAGLNKAKSLEASARLAEALSILKGIEKDYPNKDAITTYIRWIEKKIRQGPRYYSREKGKRWRR